MDQPSLSAFDAEMDKYIQGLQGKDENEFIRLCRNTGAISPEALNQLIRETHDAKRINNRFSRTLLRIADALKDYSEVIGQLASAKPLPLAIMWGSIKVVVDGAIRCREMIDMIGEQFDVLADQIEHLKAYKSLYGHSSAMQRLFFSSYRNMIRFWHRAHQECHKSRTKSVIDALRSSAAAKLSLIMDDIEKDVKAIAAEAAICQAQLDHREHCAARTERMVQSNWRKEQDEATSLNLYRLIRDHLGSTSRDAEANKRWHESRASPDDPETCAWHPSTCTWLFSDPIFTKWLTAETSHSAVLCLRGQTGCGKTTLASFAIEYLKAQSAVVYYFCQPSSSFEGSAGPLHLLAAQLFEIYISRGHPVSQVLSKQVLRSTNNQHLRELITEFLDNIDGNVYFFIDGLDEVEDERDSRNVMAMVRAVLELCDAFGGRVHLWCSMASRIRPIPHYDLVVKRCEASSMVLDMTGRDEHGVELFIHSRVDRIAKLLNKDNDGLTSDAQTVLHLAATTLVKQAQGNFLWAQLMTADFGDGDGPQNPAALRRHVSGGPPPQYAELYRRHFKRIAAQDRELSSKVMSMVAYARRLLSVDELREAVAVLLNKAEAASLKTLRADAFLHRFTVHVHVDRREQGTIDWSDTCRLDHSSVREFLSRNPVPWEDVPSPSDSQMTVSPKRIAFACLSYLQRPSFSTLLRHAPDDRGSYRWVSLHAGMEIPVHPFARYATKYWARHLEQDGLKEITSVRKRATDFITSTNFQTLLQMQMLWVEGQFSVYSVGGRPNVLRVLPDWLISTPTADNRRLPTNYWVDYCTLHHNWERFLTCDGCKDSATDCPLAASRGEIDRIWWGTLALDSQHPFSRFQARYPTFSLRSTALNPRGGNRYETLVFYGQTIHLLRFSAKSLDDVVVFVYECWAVMNSSLAPQLALQQTIHCSAGFSNLPLYTRGSLSRGDPVYAPPTAFSEDGQVLRIGAQLFIRDSQQKFHRLVLPVSNAIFPPSFDDMASCNGLIAVGNRSHGISANVIRDRDTETLDMDMTRLETWASGRRWTSSDDGDDATDTSSSSHSDQEWEGYETWSEGSTEDGMDEAGARRSDNSESDGSTSSASRSCDSSDSESSGMEPLDPTSLPQFGELDSDDEEVFWGRQMDAHLHAGVRLRRQTTCCSSASSDSASDYEYTRESEGAVAHDVNWMSLTILRVVDQSIVFQYKHPRVITLYDSPPAFHPHKPLVVWPLGAGEVLFADYEAKTYFVRQLRSSAPRTRQLSIKPHFSPCGRFLHVASLEAQEYELKEKPPSPAFEILKQLGMATRLRMHVMAATYRLSNRKTTRSPPDLIHRAKAFVGSRFTISPARLPFTFTWTEKAVFVTRRDTDLAVYKIPLFAAQDKSDAGVRVPSLKVFLPDTALERTVFFSPEDGDKPACIVLGSEPREPTSFEAATATTTVRGALAPPVLCMLDEKRDLGEWVKAADVPTPTADGAGNLEHRREKFDPEDDCDVSPYVRFV